MGNDFALQNNGTQKNPLPAVFSLQENFKAELPLHSLLSFVFFSKESSQFTHVTVSI